GFFTQHTLSKLLLVGVKTGWLGSATHLIPPLDSPLDSGGFPRVMSRLSAVALSSASTREHPPSYSRMAARSSKSSSTWPLLRCPASILDTLGTLGASNWLRWLRWPNSEVDTFGFFARRQIHRPFSPMPPSRIASTPSRSLALRIV